MYRRMAERQRKQRVMSQLAAIEGEIYTIEGKLDGLKYHELCGTSIKDALDLYKQKKEIKANLKSLKEGECSREVNEALDVYKEKTKLEKKQEFLKDIYISVFGYSPEEAAEFTPAKGGRRSRSKTQKKNRRSKKSRKC